MNGPEIQAQAAIWGVIYAAMMYVIGNGVWINHLARKRQWIGWLMWLAAGMTIIVCGAFIETRLAGTHTGVWNRLTSVDLENHWVVLILFALMSVPGAASVIFRQSAIWTRMALIIPALVVFIPLGMQLGSTDGGKILAGLGLALAVSALVFVWHVMLDQCAPAEGKKAA